MNLFKGGFSKCHRYNIDWDHIGDIGEEVVEEMREMRKRENCSGNGSR